MHIFCSVFSQVADGSPFIEIRSSSKGRDGVEIEIRGEVVRVRCACDHD